VAKPETNFALGSTTLPGFPVAQQQNSAAGS